MPDQDDDNKFFQRATVFLVRPREELHPRSDVMSDGNRRKMSEVGIINQRYAIVLKGNDQKLEVSSNFERFARGGGFQWAPNTWYHLKSRVDIAATARASSRKVGNAVNRTEAWTIEVKTQDRAPGSSPGLFGFSPQESRLHR